MCRYEDWRGGVRDGNRNSTEIVALSQSGLSGWMGKCKAANGGDNSRSFLLEDRESGWVSGSGLYSHLMGLYLWSR